MERTHLINILEVYVESLMNNEVDKIPLHEQVTFSDPLVEAELVGRTEVFEFLSDLSGALGNAQYHIERDIIDGNIVCSMLKLRLSEGEVLDMCCVIEIENDEIKSIKSFYDPRPMM